MVDPVDADRAAAGMIDLIRRGVIGMDEMIRFRNTGGFPAIWACGPQIAG